MATTHIDLNSIVIAPVLAPAKAANTRIQSKNTAEVGDKSSAYSPKEMAILLALGVLVLVSMLVLYGALERALDPCAPYGQLQTKQTLAKEDGTANQVGLCRAR